MPKLLLAASVVLSSWCFPSEALADCLYVVSQSGSVHRYSLSGQDLGLFAGGLRAPSWLATDHAGNVYVSEYGANKIDVLSPSGVLLRTVTTPFQPGGIEIGEDGTLYVADYWGGTVYRYSATGEPLGLFSGIGLHRADFLEFDSLGNLYISDFIDGLIWRVSPTGADLGAFVTGLAGPNYQGPEGMAFDEDGNLLVAVYGAGVVRRYSPTGADLGLFATVGPDAYGIALDSTGALYVAGLSGTVQAFSADGDSLGSFASAPGTRDVLYMPEPIPEPASLLLLGTGLIGAVRAVRKRRGWSARKQIADWS